MNDKDLVIYLRQADHNAHMGFGGDWKSVYAEAADHIEAQNKIIEEMREILKATRARELMAKGEPFTSAHIKAQMMHDQDSAYIASKASKSNPNTPERNDE